MMIFATKWRWTGWAGNRVCQEHCLESWLLLSGNWMKPGWQARSCASTRRRKIFSCWLLGSWAICILPTAKHPPAYSPSSSSPFFNTSFLRLSVISVYTFSILYLKKYIYTYIYVCINSTPGFLFAERSLFLLVVFGCSCFWNLSTLLYKKSKLSLELHWLLHSQ